MWRRGLRATEVAQQRVEDVALANRTLVVSCPKGFARGANRRELGLDEGTRDLLKRWLAVRPAVGVDPQTGPLIVTRNGGPMFSSHRGRVEAHGHLRRLVKLLAKRAGIKRRIHPHCLRATYARNLYDEGVGIREIQLALGHASLNTTAVYLVSIGANEVIAKTKERKW
jgi:integrase